jgi:hypothetical protein
MDSLQFLHLCGKTACFASEGSVIKSLICAKYFMFLLNVFFIFYRNIYVLYVNFIYIQIFT